MWSSDFSEVMLLDPLQLIGTSYSLSLILVLKNSIFLMLGYFVELSVVNHGDAELSDDRYQIGKKKKKRLILEQMKPLRRALSLGTNLSLRGKCGWPRQVTTWFQNRRSRWKTLLCFATTEDSISSFSALPFPQQWM